MNTKNDTMWASIRFPQTVPVEGYFNSMSVLDANGLFRGGETYQECLARAGFVCVVREGVEMLDLRPEGRGLFATGIGPAAVELLEAMAVEGFEGVLTVTSCGSACTWHLLNGRAFSETAEVEMRLAA